MLSDMEIQSNHNYILILAGGSGTRLWPASTKELPKQFQSLVTDETLLQHMYGLVTSTVSHERVLVVTPEHYGSTIKSQLPSLPAENIIYEPAKRDNGPAIILGVAEIYKRDPKAHVTILWSDHYIKNRTLFSEMLHKGFAESQLSPDALIVVGIKPEFPETNLGYIGLTKKFSKDSNVEVHEVKKFTEKPIFKKAKSFVRSRKYLWNTGYKIFSAEQFIRDIKTIHPALTGHIDLLLTTPQTLGEKEHFKNMFMDLPAISIEYLYTEFITNIKALSVDLGWSDVGTWNSLHALLQKNEDNDVISRGNVTHLDTQNTLIVGKERRIAALGVKDLIIVDTGDVILIASKEHSNDVKKFIQ